MERFVVKIEVLLDGKVDAYQEGFDVIIIPLSKSVLCTVAA